MILLLALLFPFIISFIAFKLSGKKMTVKELAVQLGVISLVVGVTYAIMLWRDTSDVELINAQIAQRRAGTHHCCHSYSCNCHQVCSGSGSSRSCSEHCSTCYEHSSDLFWDAISTTGATVYENKCNRPGTPMPARWGIIYPGEPTVEEHSYTNYIKGNPTSIMRRNAVPANMLMYVPDYPRVFDYYRAQRVISQVGIFGADVHKLNHELNYINTQLGPKREVNIILIITQQADPLFAEAVRQKWLGGKKNDLIVIVGAPHYPEIAWVDSVSWSQSEEMKIRIRDSILAMKEFDGHNVLGIIAYEVDQGFKRRHMKEFEYLTATIQPTSGQVVALFIISFVLCIGLTVLMVKVDLFGEEPLKHYNAVFDYRNHGYRPPSRPRRS